MSLAPTPLIEVGRETYAYRRFGTGPGLPLLWLQHFTGTLDNWDPGRSPTHSLQREKSSFRQHRYRTLQRYSPVERTPHRGARTRIPQRHGSGTADVLGFSLGGMLAQQMVVHRP
jgi:pimeloyl-ACP methyl ester carboxylesterase